MEPLLQLKNVSKQFSVGRGKSIHALSNVDFSIYPGETIGVVGESGCGKSTLARIIMGAYKPSQGRVIYGGKSDWFQNQKTRKAFAKRSQMIFQDPYSSLNPRMTVKDILSENLEIQGSSDVSENSKRVCELLEMVGLPEQFLSRYPHEFSGGQRQRIGIARALACGPEFIVCDEPISALDISVQSQIMNLLKQLKAEMGLTYLFIAHDLNMVRYISDRMVVMYLGHTVEITDSKQLYEAPLHPYTKQLLGSILVPDPMCGQLEGEEAAEVVSNGYSGVGCPFEKRCMFSKEQCEKDAPQLKEVRKGHFVACHNVVCSVVGLVEL